MYKVDIYEAGNDSSRQTILDLQNDICVVSSATIDKSEDNIDAFTTTVFHQFTKDYNVQFKSFKTLTEIRNKKTNKIEFRGRVLAPDKAMADSGAFSHSLVFEGAMAYLKDTVQKYSFEFDKMPIDNLRLVINHHNAEVASEPYKQFAIGTVTVEKNVIPADDQYNEELKYFKRWEDKDTYETLEQDLKGKYGGHFIVEYRDGINVLHWLKETGNKKNTSIDIGKNLKSIQYKVDPSEVITRVKPLGSTSETANGDELRLTIADVNGGSPYIDIPELINIFGIQTGIVDFPEKYAPITLKEAALVWIEEQRKKVAKVSVSLDALDLSLIGIDPDDLDIYNIHRVTCSPLNIDEDMKIVGINIDLITPHNKSITIGEKELTIDEIQSNQYKTITNNIISTQVPNMIEKQVEPIINDIVPGMIDGKVDSAIDDFERLSFNPYKATVPELMNAKITEFKNYSLGTIIENTIDTNKSEIKDSVIAGINNSTNVIRSQALVVDYAMIDKMMTNNLLTDRLVANDAYVRNLMAQQAVIDRIKSTSIGTSQLDIYGITDTQGTLPGRIRIRRPDGAYSVMDGLIQSQHVVNSSSPRYSPDGIFSVQGEYWRTNLNDYSVLDNYSYIHSARYLKVYVSISAYSNGGFIKLTSGYNIADSLASKGWTKGKSDRAIFKLDLGVPTFTSKDFAIQAKTNGETTSYFMFRIESIELTDIP